jgi:hypothetical protein
MAGRAPDTYSPILSAVIKIARFMVVQKATEMVMERYDDRIIYHRRADILG